MDARCGLPGDFDTPEYARYGAVQRRKWESNLGMDPFSYGYNRATPTSQYMNASTIVTSLIDIVSKNGNFLLDVGPQPNGTILEVEQNNLRQAGVWIKDHAEAIFNTSFWFVTPEEGDDIRFTTTMDAFYIVSIAKPPSNLTLDSPIPWIAGDAVTVVGGNMSGTVVPSKALSNGSVTLTLPDEVISGDQYAWVFKIAYQSNQTANSTTTASGTSANASSSSIPSSQGVRLAKALGDHIEVCILALMILW